MMAAISAVHRWLPAALHGAAVFLLLVTSGSGVSGPSGVTAALEDNAASTRKSGHLVKDSSLRFPRASVSPGSHVLRRPLQTSAPAVPAAVSMPMQLDVLHM